MAQTAIYLSTAGMLLAYGVETAGVAGGANKKPEIYTIIQGATSLGEISSEKEQIEVTPLSAKVYKQYVGGLADSGGSWEVGFNQSNALHEEWGDILTAYEEAKKNGLRMWFEAYHPDLDKAFYLVGEPNILGFGGAEVSSAFSISGRITINEVIGWDTAIEPKSADEKATE